MKINRRKSRALVYYLAAQARPLPRAHLLAVFWPEAERLSAQQGLRTALYDLKRTLEPWLVVDNETVAISDQAEVDLRAFEGALGMGQVETSAAPAALALYRGGFLADFSLPDGQAFEDWAVVERERLRQMMVRGWAALSKAYQQQGDYAAALASLEHILALDPLQEDLQRQAIHLHYLVGDRPGAIRRYDELRRLLDDEMGVPPMAETRALYDAIINDHLPRPPAAPQLTATPGVTRPAARLPNRTAGGLIPFTGRQVELAALLEQHASHRLFYIQGEPGIGKTRLVQEFIERFDGLALSGQARELEQSLPYQPVIEALRGLFNQPEGRGLLVGLQRSLSPLWGIELCRLLPELDSTLGSRLARPLEARQAAPDEARLWEGIHQVLLALAAFRPVLLFLDDLHWAGAATLGLLGYLVRQPVGERLSYVAAARPALPRTPLAGLLRALEREQRLEQISLKRLQNAEVTAIARALSPIQAYPLADWLLQMSEGNPFILVEMVRYAQETRLLDPNGVVNLPALSAPVIPGNLYSLVQARLDKLSDPARRVLDAAVAAGREFDYDVVARAAALSEPAALDALDELRAAELVQPVGGMRFKFDHSLTMEVAYHEVGEPRHRLLHRRVAETLEALQRDHLEKVYGLLSFHYSEGGVPEKAALYAFRAGQQAARLAAWTEAVSFFEQAVTAGEALETAAGVSRVEILASLGDAHLQAGHFPQASQALTSALALLKAGDARLEMIQSSLARSLLPQARYSEAVALARRMRQAGGPAARAELAWGAALSLEGADLAAAQNHLQAALALCQEHPPQDVVFQAQVLFELGGVVAQLGDLHKAVDLYRQSLAAAGQSETDLAIAQRILANNNLAYHLLLLGDPRASDFARAGLELAEERGVIGLRAYLYSTLGEIAMEAGDLNEAERCFTAGLEIANRLAMVERTAGLTANLGLLAQHRGQFTLAIHRLSTALAQADALGTVHLATQIRLWLVPLLPPEEARARLAEAHQMAESSGRQRLLAAVAALESRAAGTKN